jgi:hypothetical protein
MNVKEMVCGLRLRHAVGCLVPALLLGATGPALGGPRERALEQYLAKLPKNQGLVNVRYPIGDLPLYRRDEAGRPVFDASLLTALVEAAAGPEEWHRDTMTIIMPDRATLVVRQSPKNQARITAALSLLRGKHQDRPSEASSDDGESRPAPIDRVK